MSQMEDESLKHPLPDELAKHRSTNKPPDPNGAPLPEMKTEQFGTRFWLEVFGFVSVGVIVGTPMMLPCVGTTRSARFAKQERQHAVDEAIAQFESQNQQLPSGTDETENQ